MDIIDGTAVKTLIQHYEKDWMPSFSNLKLVNNVFEVNATDH